MKSRIRLFIIFSLLLHFACISAQDPERYRKEVEGLSKLYSDISSHNDLIVFTGSSSIRLWKNLKDHFPGKNIINTGFGGSQMSDLIFYVEELVARYKPVQVFIYEGDNDISSGKSPEEVAVQAEALARIIRDRLPETEIVYISAKPSPSRWNLKDSYITLNQKLSALAGRNDFISFADIWNVMINKNGRPDGSLFTADSLHINSKGYLLWAEVLRKQIR